MKGISSNHLKKGITSTYIKEKESTSLGFLQTLSIKSTHSTDHERTVISEHTLEVNILPSV